METKTEPESLISENVLLKLSQFLLLRLGYLQQSVTVELVRLK